VLWHYIAHIKARGEEVMLKRTKRFKARRWVVERTHSWFNDSSDSDSMGKEATELSCNVTPRLRVSRVPRSGVLG